MNSTTISQPALVWRGKPVQARPGFKIGMTMMETLGGILVGAILTVGAIMLIRMAMDSSKISDAQKSLTAMSIQIRGHFSGVRDYTGLSNPPWPSRPGWCRSGFCAATTSSRPGAAISLWPPAATRLSP